MNKGKLGGVVDEIQVTLELLKLAVRRSKYLNFHFVKSRYSIVSTILSTFSGKHYYMVILSVKFCKAL